ncbi:MAG TPA: glycosyltransferase [Thermoanaerobaculia bacterium]|nr:glycosyltransferase [Thermoanaerobaculia bacterium]
MFEVVVTTPDVVGERMAGPGIRVTYFARELAKIPGVNVTIVDRKGNADALRRADVLIGQPARGFWKRRRGQKIVYDMFDPTVLELRELYGAAPSVRQRVHLAAEWTRLQFALAHADLLIAAAPQQRAFYGQLQWCDVPWIDVPFGIDMSEVKNCPPVHDNVVVWGGGVWEWLDPKTAIDAIVKLNREGLRCRLLFLGRSRPNQEVVERRREDRFSQLLVSGAPYVDATEGWVPYRERLSWLRGGKAAIMLHRPTTEANFAIRTRLFDAIAAGVPVVATERGFAAELVEREGLGVVVPPQDVPAVADAIRRLLTDDELHSRCVTNLERIRPAFAWEVVTRPLVDAVTRWQKQAD